jgi:hypothetical protein
MNQGLEYSPLAELDFPKPLIFSSGGNKGLVKRIIPLRRALVFFAGTIDFFRSTLKVGP